MKKLFFILVLYFPVSLAAQTVTLDSVSKTNLCVGDSIKVYYSSSGSFQSDNFFTVQLSDASGSFTTFTNIGHKTAPSDSISIVMGTISDHWRMRVIATDPYIISKDTSLDIRVVSYPTPSPASNLKTANVFGAYGFVGDTVEFHDASNEPSGSSSLWSFGQDANIQKFVNSSPLVTYATIGTKTGTLTVSNGNGCLRTATFQINIINCTPLIPANVHIVTGTESGSFPYVWVKAGGNYSTTQDSRNNTVFVEPGGSIGLGEESSVICYLKTGASFTGAGILVGPTTVILNQGNSITLDQFGRIDTIYCPDLQFDYSQVQPKGVAEEENLLQITTTANSIHITNEGAIISATISNLLGITILSKRESDVLDIDLSALVNGVYFAIIESGNYREVKKITVVH